MRKTPLLHFPRTRNVTAKLAGLVFLSAVGLLHSAMVIAQTPSAKAEPLVLESAARDDGAALVADAPPVPINAQPVVRILGDAVDPQLPFLGVDTERGDRVKHNLLRSPLHLELRSREGTTTATNALPCVVERGDRVVRYRIAIAPDATLIWEIATSQGQWQMKLKREGAATPRFAGVDIVLPLDPRTCATSIVAGQWSKDERFALPAIMSAPDLGQFHVTIQGDEKAEGSFIGQRGIFVGGEHGYWMNIAFHLSMPDERGVSLNFTPLILPTPANVDPELWRQARRGWFNLYQLSSKWPRPGGARGAPAGLIANNVLSDPVSSLLWYHGDQALLMPELAPGVRATDVLRHTIEFWLYDAIEPDGQVWYVAAEKYQMMDANPAILIAAWCYVDATGDLEWAKKHLPRLELIADYLAKRDIDDDGLVESVQSGNAGEKTRLGDTSIDTIASGHKNAWVNALVFRAWRCLADIERKVDRAEAAQHYQTLSDKLRAAYA
nr:hypothetical protein [Chthoniobacterales bacterium]